MSLRTVIVDDEPLGRDLLRGLLADHDDVQLVAECKNGAEAISYLRSNPVDLLFLDVQMPKINGFDVVNEIGLQHLPPTVFVTAYYEHAVQAFEIHAVDYVTKPVEPERLQTALERVREKIAARAALLTQSQLAAALKGLQKTTDAIQEYPEHLLVRDGEKEILLPVDRIDWIEAAEYYCCLHVGDRGYMLREAISDLNKRLNPRKFLRIHRSSIVRLDQIREIFREGQSDGSVVLLNGQTLRMSRSGRQRLSEYSSA